MKPWGLILGSTCRSTTSHWDLPNTSGTLYHWATRSCTYPVWSTTSYLHRSWEALHHSWEALCWTSNSWSIMCNLWIFIQCSIEKCRSHPKTDLKNNVPSIQKWDNILIRDNWSYLIMNDRSLWINYSKWVCAYSFLASLWLGVWDRPWDIFLQLWNYEK